MERRSDRHPGAIRPGKASVVAMFIGEAFVGDGQNAAHVTTMLGPRDGPVGTAWATAMASPNPGHAPFMVFLQPGLSVQPPTLFVNRVAMTTQVHTELTLGPAHAGVAAGVAKAVQKFAAELDVQSMVIIASVWVDLEAYDADAIYMNNKAAANTALRNGMAHLPELDEVLANIDAPWNEAYRRYRPYG
jgi:5,6,7,8-tetrahydromethanopterin hydro-lyase